MNRKFFVIVAGVLLSILIVRCTSTTQPGAENNGATNKKDTVFLALGVNSKGIGRFKDIQLTHPLDAAMAASGEKVYEAKCLSCHKLTDEKLVGPGWKGVTDRRTPEWIMNFITNTNLMLDKDQAAQAMMVTCLVRMPSQDLTDDEARAVLEFQRKNDGKN